MASCPKCSACGFYGAAVQSVARRIRYATSFPYCNAGRHESCALYPFVVKGRPSPKGLLPTGKLDEQIDEVRKGFGMKVVVLDDAAMFAMFAANAVTAILPEASVVRCETYDHAVTHVRDASCALIVCGYGVGDGRTAHDLRRISAAPMVLFTGRPAHEIDAPRNSRVVPKGAGPDALRAAISAAVSA